jgi:hypothetical protein
VNLRRLTLIGRRITNIFFIGVKIMSAILHLEIVVSVSGVGRRRLCENIVRLIDSFGKSRAALKTSALLKEFWILPHIEYISYSES